MLVCVVWLKWTVVRVIGLMLREPIAGFSSRIERHVDERLKRDVVLNIKENG